MQFPLYNGTFVFDNNYDDGIQKEFSYRFKFGGSKFYSNKMGWYKSIRRYNDDIFIIEDNSKKFGIFNAGTSIWIAPCDNDSIYISKEGYLVVTKQSQKTLYNRSGYRIIK